MEEQINRIKSIELPMLELEGHRTALKQALLQKVIENNQKKISFWAKFTGRISEITYRLSVGVIPHRRAARVTLISGCSVAVIALILFTAVKPAFLVGPSDMVLAERLIKNSSQISAALGGADIASISFLTIKNHQADAIITGATGKSVQANVDLEQRTIDITTYLGGITTYLGNNTYETTCSPIANLITIDHENLISDEDKAKAINIAKTDPLSSMLFSEKAEITYVYRAQLQASCILTRDNGQTITTILNTSTIPAVVEVTSKNFVLTVVVDLNSEKVLALIPECVPSGSSITIPALTR